MSGNADASEHKGTHSCDEWKTQKRHECTNMGKVKRLVLLRQRNVTSLSERDVRNSTPLGFCSTECTCSRLNSMFNRVYMFKTEQNVQQSVLYLTNNIPISYKYLTNIILILYQYLTNIIPISYQYHTNIVPISYQYHTNIILILYQYPTNIIPISYQYHTNIVPISYQYHTNFIPWKKEYFSQMYHYIILSLKP